MEPRPIAASPTRRRSAPGSSPAPAGAAQAILAHRSDFDHCAGVQRTRKPGSTPVSAEVIVFVKRTGEVAHIIVRPKVLWFSPFSACLRQRARQWRLPLPPKQFYTQRVRYTLQ